MSFIAVRIARNLWAGMLWFMRRPWMRRLQRGSVKFYPEGPKRDRAWAVFKKRERFARRHGLPFLTLVVTVFLYAFAFWCVYSFISYAIERGWIPMTTSDPVLR